MFDQLNYLNNNSYNEGNINVKKINGLFNYRCLGFVDISE